MKPYGSKRQDSHYDLPFEKNRKYNLGRRDLKGCNCERCHKYRLENRRGRTYRKRLTTKNAMRSLKKRERQRIIKILKLSS